MSQIPLISVLTPTMNRGGTFLPETIERVQNQNEHGFTHEHIIVDNASTDDTEAVVRRYMEKDSRIKYIRNEKNLYASGALNIGFQNSKGGLVVPLDDDDIMPALSLQIRFDVMKDPRIKWTSGLATYTSNQHEVILPEPDGLYYYNNMREILDDNYEVRDYNKFFLSFFRQWLICNGTVTIRRECIEEVGGWDPSFTGAQDKEMWVKLAAKHFHHKFIMSNLLFYRLHESQSSKRNAANGVWDTLSMKLRDKHGITDELLDKMGIK